MEILGKLVEFALGALPPAAKALIPEHIQGALTDRVQQRFFASPLSVNHDLIRGARIAWIDSARTILDAAESLITAPEFKGDAAIIQEFGKLSKAILQKIRDSALNRTSHPGESAIDQHLKSIMTGVAEYTNPNSQTAPGNDISQNFIITLAALVHWEPHEVPALLFSLAKAGMPTENNGPRRMFGELVIAHFAELLKSPKKYPELKEAFWIAIDKDTRTTSREILSEIRAISQELENLVHDLNAPGLVQDGATRFLDILPNIQTDVRETRIILIELLNRERDRDRLLYEMRDDQRNILEEQKKFLEAIRQLPGGNSVPLNAIVEQLKRLTMDPHIEEDQIPSLLTRFIDEYLNLRSLLNRTADGDNAVVAEARRQASELFDQGDLDRAADALLQASKLLAASRQSVSLAEAQALAEAAEIHTIQANYVSAAQLFRQAADLAQGDLNAAFQYQLRLGDALQFSALHLGNFGHLDEAIAAYGAAAALPRQMTPHERWRARGGEAYCLRYSGERNKNAETLEKALSILKDTTIIPPEDPSSVDWQDWRMNLASTLNEIGTIKRNASLIREASQLMSETIDKINDSDFLVPINHYNLLGIINGNLFEQSKDVADLDKAISILKNTLKSVSRDVDQFRWAQLNFNIGIYTVRRGEVTKSRKLLSDGIDHLDFALEVRTRARFPVYWAGAEQWRASAYQKLSMITNDRAHLTEAMAGYDRCLDFYDEAEQPTRVASIIGNRALVLHAISDLNKDKNGKFKAIKDLKRASELYEEKDDKASVYWLALSYRLRMKRLFDTILWKQH